jgi:hypothetical protein
MELIKVESQLTGPDMTDEEKFLLDGLLADDGARIDVVLRSDSSPADIAAALDVCSKVHGKLQKANMKLKPIIGRILVLAQDKPEVFELCKCKTFNEFASEYIPKLTGMTRAEAYQCKRIVEKFPSITIKDFEDIGYVKMGLLCKVTQEGAPSKEKWFKEAKEHFDDETKAVVPTTIDSFKVYIAERGYGDKGDLDTVVLEVVMSKETAKEIKAFWNNRAYQDYVGSKDHGEMLKAAIGEVSIQWQIDASRQANS